jgi:hypothetical protein
MEGIGHLDPLVCACMHVLCSLVQLMKFQIIDKLITLVPQGIGYHVNLHVKSTITNPNHLSTYYCPRTF